MHRYEQPFFYYRIFNNFEFKMRVNSKLSDQIPFYDMTDVIRDQLNSTEESDNSSKIMRMAWSILMSMTDENPINGQSFLVNDGIDTFLKCRKNKVCSDEIILSSMLGTLGNIAETPDLRSKLSCSEMLSEFLSMLTPLFLEQGEKSFPI